MGRVGVGIVVVGRAGRQLVGRLCVVDERAGRHGGGGGAGGGAGAGRGAGRAPLAVARYPQTAQVPLHRVRRVRRAPRAAALSAHDATVLQFW